MPLAMAYAPRFTLRSVSRANPGGAVSSIHRGESRSATQSELEPGGFGGWRARTAVEHRSWRNPWTNRLLGHPAQADIQRRNRLRSGNRPGHAEDARKSGA